MKTILVTFISILFALASGRADTSHHDIQRKLILGGTVVAVNENAYTVGLKQKKDGEFFCGGALVSPMHVLTSSRCTVNDIRWAHIGAHNLTESKYGEQIKVLAVINHPNFSTNIEFSNDFALLELETASSIEPVKLAAADDSDFKPTAIATALGWGATSEGGLMSKELLRIAFPLMSDEECDQVTDIDETMLCAGGVISEDVCKGDTGGPLVLEAAGQDGEDVLVGVVSWSRANACGRGPFYPGIYARVSQARSWIDPIVATSCFQA